jgi:hypothetical protein
MQVGIGFHVSPSEIPGRAPLKLMLLRRRAIPGLGDGSVRHQHWQRHAAQQRAQHHSDRRPARMGAKETVLVCPILHEQRGEALTVICLNGSGESGQQIGKRQASHLVVLICRDPFWTAVITREPIMASLRDTLESGFEPTPLHRIAADFLRKELKAAGLRLWQCCMARTSIRCSKSIPNPALRHSKEAAA